MDEKILIKSERYNVKKVLAIFCVLGIIASIIFSFIFIKSEIHYYNWQYEQYSEGHIHKKFCYNDYGKLDCDGAEYAHPISNAIESYFRRGFFIALIIVTSTLLVSGIIYAWLRSYELTVTDKRVFGKVAFGKRRYRIG